VPALLASAEETHVPTYPYACTACGHTFEVQQSFTEASLTQCPECSGRLRKVFSAVGVLFKGSGFYRTDSRSNGTVAAGSGAGSSDGGGSTSGESKASKSTGSGSGSSGSGSTSGGTTTSSGSSTAAAAPAAAKSS
jgi:putative FmdB family regulatory protein